MIRTLPAALALTLASLPAQQDVDLPADRAEGAAAIEQEMLRDWLGTLASDEFEGRATGTEGFRKAADFVKARFAGFGLDPGGDDGSWFQNVPWRGVTPRPDQCLFTVHAGDREVVRVGAGQGLGGRIVSGTAAGGGLTLLVVQAPRETDLQELDLEGRVVLLHIPADVREGRRGRWAAARAALAARRAGAEAVVQVRAEPGPLQGTTRRLAGNRAVRGGALNRIHVGPATLAAVLAAARVDEDVLEGGEVRHDLQGLDASLQIEVVEEQVPAWNVIGILPGADEELRDEYVVIGSHLDHIGRRGNRINNGADDDGSGTTGVLAVARAFTENPTPPRRSILFVCFCGEENGLVGSRYFVDHAPVPLESIVAELQMDMIGRNEQPPRSDERPEDNLNSLHLIGTERLSRDLHQLCLMTNERAGFDLEYDEEDVFSRSDHANFARKGIPIAFFFTGFHPDYHRPTDTVDKIDFPKLGRVARYVYDLAFELATRDDRPLVDEDLWEKSRRALRARVEEPVAPVRRK